MRSGLFILFCFTFLVGCNVPSDKNEVVEANPPSEGFDIANSDPAAVELADSILAASGGRKAWDKIRFISWQDGANNFYWDKAAGNVRVESDSNRISIYNLGTIDGRLSFKGQEISDSVTLSKGIKQDHENWQSAARKIFMPFLLKDRNVFLKYFGEETFNGERCNLLEVNVGKTTSPVKYLLYVSLTNNRIVRSDLFSSDTVATSYHYREYQNLGGIWVSIPAKDVVNLRVDAQLDEKLFTDL